MAYDQSYLVAMPRRGRKITKHPVSTSKRKFEVDIFLDVHTGRFTASVDGLDVWSYILPDLRRAIERVACESDDEVYIDISPGIRLLPAPKEDS